MPPPAIFPIPLSRSSPPPFNSSSQPACYWRIEKPGSVRTKLTRLGPISRHTSTWPITNFARLKPPQLVAYFPPRTHPRASHNISPTPPTSKKRLKPLPILHPPPPTIASLLPPSLPLPPLSPTILPPPTPN